MATLAATVPVYTEEMLMQEHDKNLARISAIQIDVAQEYDNLGKPIPLVEQLVAA